MPHVSRERVTAFTDAAVAIALTLLVLPLIDTVRDAAAKVPPEQLHILLRAHARDFLAFTLSFVVIARFWRVHRRLFDSLAHLDEVLVTVSLAWLLGIVFLPVPTAVLVAAEGAGRGAAALYAINLAFIALTALALTVWVARRRELWETEADGEHLITAVPRSTGATVLFVAVVPFSLWLGQRALLLLLLVGPSQRLAQWLGDRLRNGQTAKRLRFFCALLSRPGILPVSPSLIAIGGGVPPRASPTAPPDSRPD